MTVYHGYRAIDHRDNPSLTNWRVDWRGANAGWGNTGRTIIRCPWDASEYQFNRNGHLRTVIRMLVGYNMDKPWERLWPGDSHVGVSAFRNFVYSLWRHGYLNTPVFMPLMHGMNYQAVNQHGEMDITANTYAVRIPNLNYPGSTSDIWARPCKALLSLAASCIYTLTSQMGLISVFKALTRGLGVGILITITTSPCQTNSLLLKDLHLRLLLHLSRHHPMKEKRSPTRSPSTWML
jgi:hypothetical protein